MQNEQSFNDKITIGGRPDASEIEELHNRGFKTVVNLLTPDEPGFETEEAEVENTGMTYASIPTSPALLDDIAMARFSQAIDSSSGPVAVHCKGGGRAGVLSLLHLAVTHGWNREKACEEAEKLKVKIGPESPYRAFFESYIQRHSAGERTGD
ncbi:TIGR01244 family protein [Abditibacterium utsteinense]|uniref:TIGR01244 family protein n=1 Tax=Abditibacterium utsteinense TaxID=1960156 RepID=A0A2S8SUE6_9BACT|nr:sulfur transferase domain-containing protein [Abditibacterium utsteinense]PQV64421.1 TIGR01244 family protein [Abditibacterium utsteinense]